MAPEVGIPPLPLTWTSTDWSWPTGEEIPPSPLLVSKILAGLRAT